MSEENKELVRRFADAVFVGRNVDAADAYISADFVDHDPWPGTPGTLEGFKAGTRAFLAAFSDLSVAFDDIVAEGDKVAVRGRIRGTHTGEFMGAPATGRQVDVPGIDIVRIRDGKMVEHWGVFDAATMMRQLGLMPSPG